jgi:DNA/RNA endonuclease YhcR with UshA esterase domain
MSIRRLLALAFAVALTLLAPLVQAQKAAEQSSSDQGPKYDMKQEVTVKGTVEEVKEVPNPKGQIGIYLMVKSGEQVLEVRLCPNSFLKEFEVVFHKGDQLTITGSKVQVNEKDVILAREIEFGNNKVVLRDPQGVPVWTWLTKGGNH